MTIAINNLKFEAVIGILDFERTAPQKVVVDLTVDYHYKKESFLDYVAVRDLIVHQMKEQKFGLLEEALDLMSQKIMDLSNDIKTVDLMIKKPNILDDCVVSVRKKLTRA